MEKCVKFNKWCKEVGIISDKVEFPAFFEGGLIGLKAKEPIKHKEMIMAVPYKCLISLDKALADPDISIVFEENKLFSPDNPDRE